MQRGKILAEVMEMFSECKHSTTAFLSPGKCFIPRSTPTGSLMPPALAAQRTLATLAKEYKRDFYPLSVCQSTNTMQVCTGMMLSWVCLHSHCSRTRVLQGPGQVQPGWRAAAFGEHLCACHVKSFVWRLCVSALKFNIKCSDENQSCWTLLSFLLSKKNSSLFLLQLENPMQ